MFGTYPRIVPGRPSGRPSGAWRKPLCALSILLLAGSSWALAGAKGAPASEVSPGWVERAALALKDQTPLEGLVKEFGASHPHKAVFPAHLPSEAAPCLNLTAADLDGDGVAEQVLFISAVDEAQSLFFVLQRQGDRWRILHREYLDLLSGAPECEVLQTEGGRRILRLAHTDGREATQRFYRMTGGRVACGLEVLKEAIQAQEEDDLHGWAEVTQIQASGEEIRMTYRYQFTAGDTLRKKLALPEALGEEDTRLVFGAFPAVYRWNEKEGAYRPEPGSSREEQIRCFQHMKDQALFARAFRTELEQVAATGTQARQALSRHFLDLKAPARAASKAPARSRKR